MRSLKKIIAMRYPSFYTSLKLFWHRFREYLERHIFGTRFQECIWSTRHLYDRDKAGFSLKSVYDPHRDQIVQTVETFLPIASVLEVGCGYGANLVRLREAFPGLTLHGVDINSKAISLISRYFKNQNDEKVFLRVGRANILNFLPENSVDLVLADAVLMFVAPDKIRETLAEFGRVAKRGIVLNEYHLSGASRGQYEGGRWVYDYVKLFSEIYPDLSCKTIKSSYAHASGNWDRFGTLVIFYHG